MIAPVLPGETLTNLLMQSRVVSDPIKNPLIGWWQEYYFFYVPIPAFENERYALINPGEATGVFLDESLTFGAAMGTATNDAVETYTFGGAPTFTDYCHAIVMAEFFRDEDDRTNLSVLDKYAPAYLDRRAWHNSMRAESQLVLSEETSQLPGVDETEDLALGPLAGYEDLYEKWEIMREHGFTTDATYSDFLKSYGVSVPEAERVEPTGGPDIRPELVRFVRQWTYPTNHVDPTTGTPTSAVSWSIAERADKKRFFKHPGFLFGVSVTRPKLYRGAQKGSAVGLLDNAFGWLPAVLAGHPYMSVGETLDSTTAGILENQTEDYWYDLKDLYLYGDQFVNFAMDAGNNHGIATPTVGADTKYASLAMVKSLFSDATKYYVRQDGVVHLDILGRQRETTPN